MNTKNWPNKSQSENFQINGFIKAYSRLLHGRKFKIESKCEKPDYIVIDESCSEKFGIELTSVYLDNRSVPDVHKKPINGPVAIPYDKNSIEKYKQRLIAAIIEKVNKAKSNYDLTHPLILSVYVNEYISIYFKPDDLEKLVKKNEGIFDSLHPFTEIVFWDLPNDDVFSVKPEKKV